MFHFLKSVNVRYHSRGRLGGLLQLHLSQHGRGAQALHAGLPTGQHSVLTLMCPADVSIGIAELHYVFVQGVHHGFGRFCGAVFGGMLIKEHG